MKQLIGSLVIIALFLPGLSLADQGTDPQRMSSRIKSLSEISSKQLKNIQVNINRYLELRELEKTQEMVMAVGTICYSIGKLEGRIDEVTRLMSGVFEGSWKNKAALLHTLQASVSSLCTKNMGIPQENDPVIERRYAAIERLQSELQDVMDRI